MSLCKTDMSQMVVTPHSHNIKSIIKKYEPSLPKAVPSDTMDFFDTLTSYYLNNHYPDYVSKLSSQINEQEAVDIRYTYNNQGGIHFTWHHGCIF